MLKCLLNEWMHMSWTNESSVLRLLPSTKICPSWSYQATCWENASFPSIVTCNLEKCDWSSLLPAPSQISNPDLQSCRFWISRPHRSFSDPGLKVTSGYADHLAICQFFFASPASFKFNLETASRVTYLYYKCNRVIYYQKYFTSFSQPAWMLKTELFCLENKIFHNMLSVSCCDTLCALNYLELPKHF